MPSQKRESNRIFLYVIISVAVCIWIYIWVFIANSNISFSSKNKPSYTNPILETENAEMITKNRNINLEKEIQEYTEIKKGKNKTTHISVYFRNLNNGNRFGLNEKEEFSPASLMKLPLLIAYYKLSEQNPWLLNKKVVYIPNQQEQQITQNFKPEKSLIDYQEYSIKELLDYMIIYSDNKASVLLESLIDIAEYKKTFTDIWITFPEFKSWAFENNIRIIDYAAFFRVLYNASYLNKENSNYVLSLLTKTTFKDGLLAGVSDDIVISHKFWERVIGGEKQLHDCWIVYYPEHPYVLCIMTRGRDRNKLETIISDIAKKIYNKVDTEYSKE